eukprot:TRINITY_DN2661_c0_g1_i10.p1 TRINITY_DN2661_c0_g1~~TRINITY_DN2661_c0_g1_i10.p1  ORF type:complete len:492 (+),score=76.64 TRINITY_DN2661_c0_g1_i10:411-1886(+)
MEIHSKEPAAQTDLSKVTYTPDKVEAPHVAGTLLKLCTWFMESGFIGPAVISFIKHKNNFTKILENTIVPEKPMFFPEFPCQDTEQCVKYVENTTPPVLRVALATECLSSYDSLKRWGENLRNSFLYWTIRDYAHAYRSGLTTPSLVAESMISIINESERRKPAMKFFIDFNATEVRKQAAQATQRFQEGNPLSILDGIFMPIKDDIDCYPHPSRGGTTWFHEIREVKCDSELVSRLRNCGVILLGKANMHEFGMGVTGNNPHHGTVRNPHSTDCYTGGSSSGPAAIVASGLCPASVGTDGGGSVRIPSALCGVVGLKPTYGRTDMKGTLCEGGTVEVVGPLAATVEDLLLVYAAMSGSSETDMSRLRPMPPCYPYLRSSDSYDLLGKIQLGKYSDWFNDVYAHEIIESSERILTLLHEQYGTETKEIVLPELEESRTAHLVSIGTEALNNCYTFLKEGCCIFNCFNLYIVFLLNPYFGVYDYLIIKFTIP